MNISFECPSCGGRVKAPAAAAGRKARCPACQQVVRVPDRDEQTDQDEEFTVAPLPRLTPVARKITGDGGDPPPRPARPRASGEGRRKRDEPRRLPILPLIGGLAALVLVGAVLWLGSGSGGSESQETEFAGRTTSEWLDAVRKSGLKARSGGLTAYEAFRDMPVDEAAIPALLSAADDENGTVRDKAREVLGKYYQVKPSPRAIKALAAGLSAGPQARLIAANLLVRAGTQAEPARPGALALLGSADRKDVVLGLQILAAIGLRDPGPVAPLLDSPDQALRADALMAMASNQDEAATILPRLISMLDGDEHALALSALVRLGPAAQPALPNLVAYWRKYRNSLRVTEVGAACDAILNIGEPAVESVRQLVAEGMEGDADELIARIATKGPAGAPFLPALLDAIDSSEEPPRNEALKAIAKLGPTASQPAAPKLKMAIQNPQLYSRSLLWTALNSLGLTAGLTVPELEWFLPPAGLHSDCWVDVARLAASRGPAANGLRPALERTRAQAQQEKANAEARKAAVGSQRVFRAGEDVTSESNDRAIEMYDREIAALDGIITTIDDALGRIGPA